MFNSYKCKEAINYSYSSIKYLGKNNLQIQLTYFSHCYAFPKIASVMHPCLLEMTSMFKTLDVPSIFCFAIIFSILYLKNPNANITSIGLTTNLRRL